MNNFTLNPRSGADRQRIVNWAEKHGHKVENSRNEQGYIVMGYTPDDLKASIATSDLKRIAQFDDVSQG